MKVYAIAYSEPDFGGESVVINFPIFVREADAEKFLKENGLKTNGYGVGHYVQLMELVE